MEWKNMLPYQFEKALKEEQICIIPVGSLERHGEHIPYGCDAGIAEKVAVSAAEITPAVVFPTYYFGQVHEASMHRGSINFPAEVLVSQLKMLLDQIAYNGFKKICILNGHGGNTLFLRFLEKTLIDSKRDYCLYVIDAWVTTDPSTNFLTEDELEELKNIYEKHDGHAGETETSVCMAAMPGLVDLSRQVFPEPIERRGLMDGFKGIYTGYYFNADWAQGVTGYPSLATEEKGRRAMELIIRNVSRAIRFIQEDQNIPALQKEILEKCEKLKNQEY